MAYASGDVFGALAKKEKMGWALSPFAKHLGSMEIKNDYAVYNASKTHICKSAVYNFTQSKVKATRYCKAYDSMYMATWAGIW